MNNLNSMWDLRDEDGIWDSTNKALGKLFMSHFSKLFKYHGNSPISEELKVISLFSLSSLSRKVHLLVIRSL